MLVIAIPAQQDMAILWEYNEFFNSLLIIFAKICCGGNKLIC